jgi:hypothetical protein
MQNVPPSIRTDFNWPDEFKGIVTGYPVDAHCVGGAGCDNTVEWHADFHGCTQELLCTAHVEHWAALVQGRINIFGSVICNGCGREFANILDMVTTRPV